MSYTCTYLKGLKGNLNYNYYLGQKNIIEATFTSTNF